MKTFYLPALGYSDTDTHRWLTLRLYERIDGVYMHGGDKHYGGWCRNQLQRLEGEVTPHKFALLNAINTLTSNYKAMLVTSCPRCGAVQEHQVERATYAVQCPGCRRLLTIEELLEDGKIKGTTTGGNDEIDSKLKAEMRRLACLQGYSVRASD